MLNKILIFLKNKFLIEKVNDYNQELLEETVEFDCFDSLYKNFVLEDFAIFGKKNFLNKDFENFVFNDLNYANIYNILNDNFVYNFITNIGEKNIKFLNLASGAGKIAIFMNIFYKIAETVAVENIYELYRLSKYIFAKLINSDLYSKLLKNEEIYFINDSIFNVDFNKFNIIFVDYNNNNPEFNEILRNKIEKECKSGTLIIKIMDPIEENNTFELKKTKILKNDIGEKFFVYFYETR